MFQHLKSSIMETAFSLSTLLFVGLLVKTCSAQYLAVGFCPRVYGVANFSFAQYEGKWYEAEKYGFLPELSSACVTIDALDRRDGRSYAVEFSLFEGFTNRKWKMPGIDKITSKDGSASFILDLLITMSPIPFRVRVPYKIVELDYSSHAVHYGCTQVGGMNFQGMWILARNKTLTEQTRKVIYERLLRLGLDTSRLKLADHSACPP